MGSLADHIEAYLKRLLDEMDQGVLDIRRTDLAERFQCVPSQINYVLKTRFTTQQGYIVESRRGGGGFIRIIRVSPTKGSQLCSWIYNRVGKSITREAVHYLLTRLQDTGLLRDRDAVLIRSVIEQETRDLEPPLSDIVRASLFRSLLVVTLGVNCQ